MAPTTFERTLANAGKTMVLSEIMRLAIDSFRVSKVRFALTALGMVIGAASLILVVTIGLTGKQYALDLIQGIGANMIWIDYSGGSNSIANNSTQRDFLTIEDMNAVLNRVPGVTAASPMLELHTAVSVGSGNVKDVLVLGVSPQYSKVRNLAILSGRFFDEEDASTHSKAAVVTEPFARSLFGSTGEAIGREFKLAGIPFVIVGTFRERVPTFGQSEIADQTILIPYEVARYFTGTPNVKQIFFSMGDASQVPDATKRIQEIVQSRHRANSVYNAQNLTQLLTVAAEIANGLTVMLLAIAAITLLVSGVGIMNIMLATVRARVREIGIRKAVGATYREIQLQFLVEAIFISLSGGIIGTLIGLAVPISARMLTSYQVPISYWSVVIALGTSVVVGVVFGTLPATRAAQMDPVESLKYE